MNALGLRPLSIIQWTFKTVLKHRILSNEKFVFCTFVLYVIKAFFIHLKQITNWIFPSMRRMDILKRSLQIKLRKMQSNAILYRFVTTNNSEKFPFIAKFSQKTNANNLLLRTCSLLGISNLKYLHLFRIRRILSG